MLFPDRTGTVAVRMVVLSSFSSEKGELPCLKQLCLK